MIVSLCEERWNQENFQQGIGDESWICGGLDESHSNGIIAAPKCGKFEDFGALLIKMYEEKRILSYIFAIGFLMTMAQDFPDT